MLASLTRALLDLVYPPRCAACRAPLDGEPFCPICAGAIDPVPSGCARCGLPGLAPACGACLAAPPAFERVRAAGLFGGPLADAVHGLKYGGRAALARPLGAWLAARAPLPPGAVVVSVPLGRARRIARGYDQAALLADGLVRAAGVPVRRLRGALVRVRETPPQVGRTRAERLRNVAGAFAATAAVAGRHVVLVDDVVTTGATAEAAATALRRAGARSVEVVALARAG
ncbi:ComF family protein [Anaeromyxobacter oryzae]|uniref:Phosphoribosyltransferase n=1 Tax=Anaeromyxobacter oryzae TaxID=2918170 RepID=A0ABM7WWA9_9BACT|nr:phosphoribosyltransferase family protein [Anaeromyxobacter oryzae]BDG03796.1 phosphoribosyltransferase [Anaeromyxobacter oryzae]